MAKETKAAAPKLLTVKVADDLATVEYTIKNHSPLVLTIANLSDEVRNNAIVLGMGNKIRDMIANLKAETHSDADRYDVIQAAVSHFNGGGDWAKAEREGTGQFSLLCVAMERVYGDTAAKTEATITKTMEKKGIDRNAAIKYWLATEKIGLAVLEIKKERLARKTGNTADADLEDLRG